jgi:glutamate N-acetyltransferase/amino-acid N-acetyltransferase
MKNRALNSCPWSRNHIKEEKLLEILKDKTITDVPGFKAAGVYSGLRKKKRKDLCVIYSGTPCTSAATFTTNKVKAAPIIVNMEHIKSEHTRAIVVNSGNANACNGPEGLETAYLMAQTAAECLSVSENEVLVGSTGVIGVPLPRDIIIHGIKKACSELSSDGGHLAAEAIMTTDTVPKEVAVEIEIGGHSVIIAGMAKGSGMIHPNMATMFGFVMTNAAISKLLLSDALKSSVMDSFNMVSVDRDTSTNDMVIALANGTAGNRLIDNRGPDFEKFRDALFYVCRELAKMIAKDGEGATKLIEVSLYNARTKEDARLCARSIIMSNLVKAAIFGSDANWGRIICAMGYSGGEFSPEKADITFKGQSDSIQVVKDGIGLPFDEERAKELLDEEYVNITVDLMDGSYDATAWGCDLSYDYVKINGAYRT